MEIKLPFTENLAMRFDALFQLLNRKYDLSLQELHIANQIFRIFKVADVDKVIDRVLEEISQPDDYIPYWADLWPSAVGLSQYLIEQVELNNKLVLELGSGLGLVGIAAAKKGGKVILSDYLEDALYMSEMNWLLNLQNSPETMLLDWRRPATSRKFEILLASDVAYERRMFEPLLEAFRHLLAPGGEVILSEPNRSMARDFFKLLQEAQFDVQAYPISVSLNEIHSSISVYRITRR